MTNTDRLNDMLEKANEAIQQTWEFNPQVVVVVEQVGQWVKVLTENPREGVSNEAKKLNNAYQIFSLRAKQLAQYNDRAKVLQEKLKENVEYLQTINQLKQLLENEVQEYQSLQKPLSTAVAIKLVETEIQKKIISIKRVSSYSEIIFNLIEHELEQFVTQKENFDRNSESFPDYDERFKKALEDYQVKTQGIQDEQEEHIALSQDKPKNVTIQLEKNIVFGAKEDEAIAAIQKDAPKVWQSILNTYDKDSQ